MMRSRFTKSAHALSQYGGRIKPAGAAVATLLSLPTRAFGFATLDVLGVDAGAFTGFTDLAALVVLRAAPFKPVAAMSSGAAVLRRAFATAGTTAGTSAGTTAPFKVASWAAAPNGDTIRVAGRRAPTAATDVSLALRMRSFPAAFFWAVFVAATILPPAWLTDSYWHTLGQTRRHSVAPPGLSSRITPASRSSARI